MFLLKNKSDELLACCYVRAIRKRERELKYSLAWRLTKDVRSEIFIYLYVSCQKQPSWSEQRARAGEATAWPWRMPASASPTHSRVSVHLRGRLHTAASSPQSSEAGPGTSWCRPPGSGLPTRPQVHTEVAGGPVRKIWRRLSTDQHLHFSGPIPSITLPGFLFNASK